MDSHLVWDPATERLVVKEFRLVARAISWPWPKPRTARRACWCGTAASRMWSTKPTSPEAFAFMASEVSREKPVNYDAIFHEFMKNRGGYGNILWVIGPALVHARGRVAMEWMIHNASATASSPGNAVGVHDVEAALFGTTLGMMADGSGAAGGHSVHMRAINEVKKAGSIRQLVDSGRLQGGIMHALTVTDTPYVLAGSIRDDGPLPGDHSLGPRRPGSHAGADGQGLDGGDGGDRPPRHRRRQHAPHLLPSARTERSARSPLICVDQTEFVVNKLKDRGTHQAFGRGDQCAGLHAAGAVGASGTDLKKRVWILPGQGRREVSHGGQRSVRPSPLPSTCSSLDLSPTARSVPARPPHSSRSVHEAIQSKNVRRPRFLGSVGQGFEFRVGVTIFQPSPPTVTA